MIANANRSFTDDSGLKNSHLAYMVLPGGHILWDIFTRGVFPTVSPIFSSGGPYPSPLLFARRGIPDAVDTDERADGAVDKKAETMPRPPPPREVRAPRRARFDLENFIAGDDRTLMFFVFFWVFGYLEGAAAGGEKMQMSSM